MTEYLGFNGFDISLLHLKDLKNIFLTVSVAIKEENVEVILNGVDLELFRSQNLTTKNSQEHPFTVAYSGSYAEISRN